MNSFNIKHILVLIIILIKPYVFPRVCNLDYKAQSLGNINLMNDWFKDFIMSKGKRKVYDFIYKLKERDQANIIGQWQWMYNIILRSKIWF